eukprot:5281044-Prymnesium_polylepis.4
MPAGSGPHHTTPRVAEALRRQVDLPLGALLDVLLDELARGRGALRVRQLLKTPWRAERATAAACGGRRSAARTAASAAGAGAEWPSVSHHERKGGGAHQALVRVALTAADLLSHTLLPLLARHQLVEVDRDAHLDHVTELVLRDAARAVGVEHREARLHLLLGRRAALGEQRDRRHELCARDVAVAVVVEERHERCDRIAGSVSKKICFSSSRDTLPSALVSRRACEACGPQRTAREREIRSRAPASDGLRGARRLARSCVRDQASRGAFMHVSPRLDAIAAAAPVSYTHLRAHETLMNL